MGSSLQSAEASVSRYSSDSELLKDNELDLLQSQSILQALVPVSGDSSEESNQRPSKRAGKDKGSSAKRSNSAVDPTFNICFTNSQEFASLLTYSELENNENTAVHYEELHVSSENISVKSTERSNEVINKSSANSTVNEVINNSSPERVNEVIYYSSIERSNEVNDITVNESNVAIVENVAEMESVDVMAGAVAATIGRPLIEVIDEGQADLSSDEIESLEDSSSSLSLPLIFSDPPPDFADTMDEIDSPPKDTSSPPSVPLLLVKLGLVVRGKAFALKSRVRVGLLVFISPHFLSLCLASTFCHKMLLANQKGLVFVIVLPLRSLICSSLPQQ